MAEAFDKYGRRKMNFLKWVMLIVFFSGLLIGWGATYMFVKRVISPLESLNYNLHHINSTNLQMRLTQNGQGQEVDSLAASFNQMLERLQQSFSIQKDFVHYASHELRTPLTAMIGVTENALGKQMNLEEHTQVLEQLYQQQQALTGITNSLLLLSDNRILTDRDYPGVRIDELLFRSIEIIQALLPSASIEVNFEGEASTEESLMINGNEPLLTIAINNLLKNALQYADDGTVIVIVRISKNIKELIFKNRGAALSAQEKKMIFTPFYRAPNANVTKGHGLGLPLVKQIAELHKASISYSHDGTYNVFSLSF